MPANDQFWRPLGTMHKVFAVSALVLLAATWLMMAKDHRDEWRQYQVTADQLKADQLNQQLSEVQTTAYVERKEDLEKKEEDALDALDAQADDVAKQKEIAAQIQGEVDLLARETKFTGAKRDVARAKYDISVRDNRPSDEQQRLKAEYDRFQKSVDEMALQLDVKKRELRAARADVAAQTADYDKIAAEIKALQSDSERINKALANIAPNSTFQKFKRWLMLQPIVDGFNSPHRIYQEWLPDLPITLGMATTARFDRCRTCHVNINDFAAGNVPTFPAGKLADGKYPQPYSGHPNPDVYLSSTSPHPMPKFGCTICHDGDGSGTSFQNAEHTPDNPAVAEKWHDEHHWHANHYWEYPMQPDRFIESGCLKCHHSVVELGVNKQFGATAPKVYKGYETIKTYGCFGCHEINGYDGADSIGPDLRLEPAYSAAARQFLTDPVFDDVKTPRVPTAVSTLTTQVQDLDRRARDESLWGKDAAPQQLLKAAGSLSEEERERAKELADQLDEDPDQPEVRAELQQLVLQQLLDDARSLSATTLGEARSLAEQLANNLHLTETRSELRQLIDLDSDLESTFRVLLLQLPEDERASVGIGPYLSNDSRSLSDAFKDAERPGRERKVGPSLRHIASKSTPEFIAYWTEMPSRFRPETRMPQFFHLSNQQDAKAKAYQPVQLAAVAAYLTEKSQPLETMQPKEGYVPDVERGKTAFSQRGCLACHQYDDPMFAGATATFGPNLTKEHEKIKGGHKPGEAGFNWLYTWVRDPLRHHARTKMPNLFLLPEGEGDNYVDPAADIAAFLLQGGPKDFPAIDVDGESLDELVEMFARKALTKDDYEKMIADHAFPADPASIKGDEIELARRDDDPKEISDEEWQQRKLVYVGRRTISFYGCYGCHDIPEFEMARPIGTALQDWGRKDTSKLALEHIEEFLHHHGAPHADDHGAGHEEETVPEIAEQAVRRQFYDGDAGEEGLATAFFYENLQHHGRPGFLWQKLRQPRSYDYKKIETKGYDERLRMPKFPFKPDQVEAVATFVLGLVADPPPTEYLYQPQGRPADVIEGERLLDKYNCGGCHVIDLPEIAFSTQVDDLMGSELGPADYQQALDLLLELKPAQDGLRRTPTGEPVVLPSGENVVEIKGLVVAEPDYDEDPEYQEFSFDLWETLKIGDKMLFPGSRMLVPAAKLVERKPSRGGDFAQWLVPQLMKTRTEGNRDLAWQASPPPLYKEGIKVQTPWLYEFLKNPERLRFTTVLRMPRFNMSDDEARSLANYFAAADGAAYPYQSIPQQQPPYLDARHVAFHDEFPQDGEGYLAESWNLLNAPLCMKCHSVGGNEYKSNNPKKEIRGPNLERVAKRLRPDWTLLWLYHPKWITPYTSMPAVFPKNQAQLTELFGGDGQQQTVATRDALMNYYRLLEAHGSLAYKPKEAEAAPQDDAANDAAQNEAVKNDAPATGAGGQ